ncbi:MAG TPA: peroxiredoxin [Acidimicrobiales bacterium]|nr:peroxiredoxin [Acidimicrobiales bacterium]
MDIGDVVPDFELDDDTGTRRSLSSYLAQGPVTLFFYPAAMTYGCTKESCHFRDLKREFEELGALRVGISADPVSKQRQFSDKHSFDFPLLSDPDRAVAQIFGVKSAIGLIPVRRATFVIDTDRRVIGVVRSEVSMHKHADRALDVLRGRGGAR